MQTDLNLGYEEWISSFPICQEADKEYRLTRHNTIMIGLEQAVMEDSFDPYIYRLKMDFSLLSHNLGLPASGYENLLTAAYTLLKQASLSENETVIKLAEEAESALIDFEEYARINYARVCAQLGEYL